MKSKFAPGILSSLLFLAAARAETNFQWWPKAGSLTDQNNLPIAAGNATVLTFASSDTERSSGPDPMARPFATVYGNDLFYAAMPTINYLGQGGTYTVSTGGDMQKMNDDFVGRFVYAIVLNYPFSSFTALGATDAERLANIPLNTFYGVSAIAWLHDDPTQTPLALAKLDVPPVPLIPQQLSGGAVQTSFQVIPEPGVAGLALLGLATVLFRRRRARG